MRAKARRTKSKFLEVECRKCKEITIVFSKPAEQIICKKCGAEIALPTGGQAFIVGKVLRVLD